MELREFFQDIRGVITAPSQRFAVICERGSIWASLMLLLVPAYFGFTFAGGVYFDRDPFPGYSFILPAVLASLVVLFKTFSIHAIARLFEGRGRFSRGKGTFRGLLTVIGYASVPHILALLLFLLVFLSIPEQTGSLFRDFRIAAISVLIAAGVALFIWVLILSVLALRRVYQLRDLHIVAALILGGIIGGAPLLALVLPVAGEVRFNSVYLRPVLSQDVMRFFASDPVGEVQKRTVRLHVDRLVYRFKSPKRFDLVWFEARSDDPKGNGANMAGRVIGMPGESVELVAGRHRIDGQLWEEPYIPSEFQAGVSFESKKLGPAQYLVCPEDRRLVDSLREQLVVNRDQIRGRLILNKWPFGWFFFRQTAFLKGHPAADSTHR